MYLFFFFYVGWIVFSFYIRSHRSGFGSSSGRHLSSAASKPKKPCVEELSNRQASHERVVPPKKRKTPHVRKSKRATLPGVINDEWAMLEWEEDEQTLRHGKGPAERSEQEASPFDEVEVDFSDDEHEEDGVHPVRLGNRPNIDYS